MSAPERAGADLRVDLASSCVWLRTEPHSIDRLWWLEDARRVDLHDLLETPMRGRRRAAAEAQRRVGETLTAEPSSSLVFDTTEGWLSTSLSNWAARTLPGLRRVGLQHGVLEMSGMIGKTPVRRVRKTSSRWAERVLGYAPVGAGFGNNPFTDYLVFGPLHSEYIRSLHPRAHIVESFPQLTSIGRFVDERSATRSEPPTRCVFLDQAFDGDRSDDILRHLYDVGAGEMEIVYRPHPKQTAQLPSADLVTVRRDERLADVLLSDETTLFVSYCSTGLHEAAWLGHPILSIRVPAVKRDSFDSFDGVVEIDEFLAARDLTRRSSVRPGYLGSSDGSGTAHDGARPVG